MISAKAAAAAISLNLCIVACPVRARTFEGPVSVPATACRSAPYNYYYCGYMSVSPLYAAGDVITAYADIDVLPGTFYATSCDQSWTGSALNCGSWQNTTSSGNVDFGFSGFSAIPYASLSQWDYFYTEMTDAGGMLLRGNGFD